MSKHYTTLISKIDSDFSSEVFLNGKFQTTITLDSMPPFNSVIITEEQTYGHMKTQYHDGVVFTKDFTIYVCTSDGEERPVKYSKLRKTWQDCIYDAIVESINDLPVVDMRDYEPEFNDLIV